MEQIQSALEAHLDQMADLVHTVSADFRSGLGPAFDNLIGFFHAINWKETWLMCLLAFHFLYLVTAIISRKNLNFQMLLFLTALAGVYLAERFNGLLRQNWRSFASQNYFDSNGVFVSVLWSGPLLVIAIIILINTLFSLCHLIVKWKKAELRHRARLSQNKQD
ncbi:PREDICTED: transmembrane protein 18 [Fragaria vesca subsp. vesca]|uniref:transmembrane protein 18 n=1 Tax=Fragaria vesca subsp. vesca TaxID=101020 RepID=UPI0002C2EA87|nr:PREDICTED: transmembrane protein 18 [Fragaria vesca subsp. vesca]